ncbi:MAG: hypothetical protein ACP5GI_08445 [Sulfolobales archaeon]
MNSILPPPAPIATAASTYCWELSDNNSVERLLKIFIEMKGG